MEMLGFNTHKNERMKHDEKPYLEWEIMDKNERERPGKLMRSRSHSHLYCSTRGSAPSLTPPTC